MKFYYLFNLFRVCDPMKCVVEILNSERCQCLIQYECPASPANVRK